MPGKRQRNRVFVRIQIFALETTGSIRVPKRALEASWLGPEIALERKKIITYSIDSFVFVLSSYELKKDSILFFFFDTVEFENLFRSIPFQIKQQTSKLLYTCNLGIISNFFIKRRCNVETNEFRNLEFIDDLEARE